MNRKEIAVLGGLILLLLLWPMMGPRIERQLFPQPEAPERPAVTEDAPAPTPELRETPPVIEAVEALPPEPDAEPAEPDPVVQPEIPEQTTLLTNDLVRLELTTRGGAFTSALLKAYRQTVDEDSPPVLLDFGPRRALAYSDLPGFDRNSVLHLREVEPGRMVQLEARSPDGIVMKRTLHLDDRYVITAVDTFSNTTQRAVSLPQHSIELGMMQDETGGQAPRGVVFLGADAQLHGGRGVEHFGRRQLPNAAKRAADGIATIPTEGPIDWLSAKSRYFVQILRPEDDTVKGIIFGAKEDPRDRALAQVSGDIVFPAITLDPGQTFQRNMSYYAGPKRYSIIRELRNNQAEVMEFGLFSPICKFLLWVLNLIHERLWPHNYGLAIILLTIVIRGIFWPITHKSTESMRKMQELAPVLQEVKEKYKDNPQKQQQAMMEIYRENKVNPLGGCMPMLIQIPVFFALFVVLRSAIELRFAGFLWVRDLSEPENLFAGMLPFGLGLNILPILNAASMSLQQRLTPTAGDPRQANMMKFMPIMMLILFYNFASGLVLYWTTNQVVMMTQQVLYHRRRERQKQAKAVR